MSDKEYQIDQDYTVKFYRTFWKKEWRWRIKANNNKIIASSTEGFKNLTDAKYNLQLTGDAIQGWQRIRKMD